ncbi:hypothetical protein Cflav_PD0406 [Pedosphaera parvula Ellin514]|uniref:Uncharacterized protein n=1 Tax=Pedosphaera parvula (strain Ellin514) TaxID=320771 RepID=B9XSC0_PEDPL|nr:hypothetical protein Cflav_PD0406 [Pedosphaera parvula Ellin514]
MHLSKVMNGVVNPLDETGTWPDSFRAGLQDRSRTIEGPVVTRLYVEASPHPKIPDPAEMLHEAHEPQIPLEYPTMVRFVVEPNS